MQEQLDTTTKPRKMITVVCACILANGGTEVLLSTRHAPGVVGLDGKWELPGGKIEFGETPEQAIVREIREELGLDIRAMRLLPYLHTNVWEYPHMIQHVVLAGYVCEVLGAQRQNSVANARWFHHGEIDFDFTLPGTREFVSLAFHDERFDRLCIRFRCSDQENDREFTVVAQPTMFSQYGLVKYWGRIGSRLRMRIEEFDSPKELDDAIVEIAKRRLADGYRIAEIEVPEGSYKPLMAIIEHAKEKNQPPAPPLRPC